MRLITLALACLPSLAMADGFFTLKGHGGPIMGISVAPDGQIATASFDNAVGLWSEQTPEWLDGHEAAVNAVHFAGTQLLSAGDDFTLRVWPSGEVLTRHKGKVTSIASHGDLIATASWDGTIGLTENGETRFLTGHRAGVNDIAFSWDGTRLYSASSDGTLRIWDVAQGQEKQQLLSHGFGINELILNEAAGWIAYGAVDGVTRVIDAETADPVADFTLERRPILAMALSPDATRIAVGDGEGYIMLIDAENWRIARDFRATLRGPVWALAFSPDGTNIHAGGLDPAMYSWPVASLSEHGQMGTQEQSFLKDPETMENGERQFARKCSICHTLTPGSARRAGPTLHGIFGRLAGTVDDYTYSATLDGSSIIWNETTIDDLFEEGPDNYIPGSKMPMQVIASPQDRDDLIAFLRRATEEEQE